jgi:hypothetical protein
LLLAENAGNWSLGKMPARKNQEKFSREYQQKSPAGTKPGGAYKSLLVVGKEFGIGETPNPRYLMNSISR